MSDDMTKGTKAGDGGRERVFVVVL